MSPIKFESKISAAIDILRMLDIVFLSCLIFFICNNSVR